MGILTACQSKETKKEEIYRNVILTKVENHGDVSQKTFSGVVEEKKNLIAAFMTGGKILSMKVKEGERVYKGQLLASLDDSDYQIGVNQLKIQFEQMKAEKSRMDEMNARHNIAPNDYEKFQAGYEQLKLQLEMAENKLGYTKLYAPSDGFISYRYMQPGELVDAGTPIYKISDDSRLEVSVDLPLALYLERNSIKSIYGNVPNLKESFPLAIESFTPDADNNQLYHMKLSIPGNVTNDLTPGMNISVLVDIQNQSSEEVKIPSRTVFDYNGNSYVWIYNHSDSTITKKNVVVIGQPEDGKSLVSGITGDEEIVATGVKQLKEGEKVNVISSPLTFN